jgi:hypothetical protein
MYESLMGEVCDRADLNIGSIIAKAFRAAGTTCPHCQYPQNAGLYDELLWEYTYAKRRLHHITSQRGFQPSDHLRINCEKAVYALQTKMSSIRPCPTCRARFNPTSRRNHLPKRTPQTHEFTDD